MQRPQLGHNTSPSKNPRCPNKFRNTQRLRPARFSNAPARPAHPQRTVAAFSAAKGLVFKGVKQPSGYTEPLLHAWRLREKAGRAR